MRQAQERILQRKKRRLSYRNEGKWEGEEGKETKVFLLQGEGSWAALIWDQVQDPTKAKLYL